MILDAETLDLANAVEAMLEAATHDELTGEVKPELMESVLEIATEPCRNTAEAGEQLRAPAPAGARGRRRATGLAIGAGGTHPFAMWEDQRIVGPPALPRPRSARCASSRARRSSSASTCTWASTTPTRRSTSPTGCACTCPCCSALSANSPFWRADATGLDSTRTPIFRAFPRVGIPPTYKDWADYERRIEFMVESGVIEDYTYLWYDVRPHPNFGTVEVRVLDAQTRVEHTLGAGRARPGDGQGAGRALRSGQEALPLPVRDARREQVAGRAPRPRGRARRPARGRPRAHAAAGASACCDRLREHAQDLGSAARARGARGSARAAATAPQRQMVVYEANHDLREVVAEIVAADRGVESDNRCPAARTSSSSASSAAPR